ncbi:MAG TPA: MFS transporter [Bacteroidota bacterium]|nr:MFS transporter [Bacteroidota bacterium]
MQIPPPDTSGTLWQKLAQVPTFRSLQHRNYRLFFFGQIFSLIGTWMQSIAMSWLVYQLTYSSIWLGTIGFLTSIPSLFLSLFAGTLADRMSKRKLIFIMQSAALCQALMLGILVFTEYISISVVAVFALTLGIINAFDIPSRQSFLIHLVGKQDLANAIALNSAVFNAARIMGPAIGGIVIGVIGVGWCFTLNAISFIAVLYALYRMNVEEPPPQLERSSSVRAALKESVAYIRSDISLTGIMILVAVVTTFGWSYSVLLPIFADRELHIGAAGLGRLSMATGIGAFISAITVASSSQRVQPDRFIFAGIGIFAVSIIGFGLSTNSIVSMLCLVGVGMGLIACFSTTNATLQASSPDWLRGRVMGLYSLVFQGMMPIGSLLSGFVARGIGVRWTVSIGGLVCAAAAVAVYSVRKGRHETL